MTDHKDNNHIDPTLLDTQRLLLGVDLPEDVPFDLEDILAEYGGGHTDAPPPEEPQAPEPPPPDPEPEPEPEPAPPRAPAQTPVCPPPVRIVGGSAVRGIPLHTPAAPEREYPPS